MDKMRLLALQVGFFPSRRALAHEQGMYFKFLKR